MDTEENITVGGQIGCKTIQIPVAQPFQQPEDDTTIPSAVRWHVRCQNNKTELKKRMFLSLYLLKYVDTTIYKASQRNASPPSQFLSVLTPDG